MNVHRNKVLPSSDLLRPGPEHTAFSIFRCKVLLDNRKLHAEAFIMWQAYWTLDVEEWQNGWKATCCSGCSGAFVWRSVNLEAARPIERELMSERQSSSRGGLPSWVTSKWTNSRVKKVLKQTLADFPNRSWSLFFCKVELQGTWHQARWMGSAA